MHQSFFVRPARRESTSVAEKSEGLRSRCLRSIMMASLIGGMAMALDVNVVDDVEAAPQTKRNCSVFAEIGARPPKICRREYARWLASQRNKSAKVTSLKESDCTSRNIAREICWAAYGAERQIEAATQLRNMAKTQNASAAANADNLRAIITEFSNGIRSFNAGSHSVARSTFESARNKSQALKSKMLNIIQQSNAAKNKGCKA